MLTKEEIYNLQPGDYICFIISHNNTPTKDFVDRVCNNQLFIEGKGGWDIDYLIKKSCITKDKEEAKELIWNKYIERLHKLNKVYFDSKKSIIIEDLNISFSKKR